MRQRVNCTWLWFIWLEKLGTMKFDKIITSVRSKDMCQYFLYCFYVDQNWIIGKSKCNRIESEIKLIKK